MVGPERLKQNDPKSQLVRGIPVDAEQTSRELTLALNEAATGKREALDALLPLVYDELHKIAAVQMNNERKDHTFQATVLVHEAYFKLVGQRNLKFENRKHFLAAASKIIRRILIDHARGKNRIKRGDAKKRVGLEVAEGIAGKSDVDLVELNDALERLEQKSERSAKVVEMRFFGGLTMEEIADVLKVALGTVNNDWAFARAWLARELARGKKADDSEE
jgi:RNA polymerase sigma-70 factor (ECF subfamily)